MQQGQAHSPSIGIRKGKEGIGSFFWGGEGVGGKRVPQAPCILHKQ